MRMVLACRDKGAEELLLEPEKTGDTWKYRIVQSAGRKDLGSLRTREGALWAAE